MSGTRTPGAGRAAAASSLDGLQARAQALTPHLAERLVAWQRQSGRHHLPWQGVQDPYRVWLSEIMLQQTQVMTVLGYYERFLKRFPDVKALAAASLDEVLTLWSGLGYYSRARNLHRCAQAVAQHFDGVFPRSAEALCQLPGIGPSTASAIAAFCFDERISILDGNVKRVLTRALAWGEDLAMVRHERALWQVAHTLVPARAQDMANYTQGLMDLGATVCSVRKPNCPACPWSDLCVARAQAQVEAFPVKTRKLKRSQRESWCLWLEHDEAVWLVQRPATGVWAGLWTLPLFDSEAALRAQVVPWQLHDPEPQPSIHHVLTHLDWHLHPRRLVCDQAPSVSLLTELVGAGALAQSGRWVPLADLHKFGLPAPFRRLLQARPQPSEDLFSPA